MADSNKIKYGLSKCYYAVATIGTDGSATYTTPVALPGAVSISLDPQGDTGKFYADNIAYYVTVANNGYEGSLELAKVPEGFLKDALGYAAGGNGVLYEDAGAKPVHFALMFQFEGDATAKRHVFYNCVAERPNTAGQTKEESIDPQTETINITATSVYALSKDIVKGSVNEGDAAYSTWFTTVALPTST